jgi:hypothetical protein
MWLKFAPLWARSKRSSEYNGERLLTAVCVTATAVDLDVLNEMLYFLPSMDEKIDLAKVIPRKFLHFSFKDASPFFAAPSSVKRNSRHLRKPDYNLEEC